MNGLEVREIRALPDGIVALEAAAVSEGFRFLTRLLLEWENGSNRFDQPGECLLGVWCNGELIAVGGLSRDPHASAQTGRLRRLYVAPSARRQRVGEALVQALLARATQHFQTVRLLTDTEAGAAFYVRCGFRPVQSDRASHEIAGWS